MSRNTRYVVTSIHPVLGHAPGEEFSADLPEGQEAALIGGGAIARKADVDPKPKPKPAAHDNDD